MSKFSSKLKDRFAKKENGRAHFPEDSLRESRVEDVEDDPGSKFDRTMEPSPPTFERGHSPMQLQTSEAPSPAGFEPEPSPPLTPPRFLAKVPSPSGRQLKDPIPTPRSPTQAEVSREALENILQSVSPHSPQESPPSPDSPPDSGISLASPNRQMITSTLFDRFSASPTKGQPSTKDKHQKQKSPEKEKPSFSKIFGEKRQQSDDDELEAPPRVRRPSREGRHYASTTLSSQTQPLSIQTLTQMATIPPVTSTTTTKAPSAPPLPPQNLLRPARPPPLPLSAVPTVRTFQPQMTFVQPRPPEEEPDRIFLSQPPIYAKTSPTSRSQAKPTSSQSQRPSPSYTTSETIRPQKSRDQPQGPALTYAETPRSRPYEELGLPPAEEAPMRHGPQTGRRPPISAASAVAELLTSRQPVSLRIHIQKHKTETSYQKSQTFGSNPSNSGQGSSQPKKNGNGYSESSI